jgi:hypothetical protein
MRLGVRQIARFCSLTALTSIFCFVLPLALFIFAFVFTFILFFILLLLIIIATLVFVQTLPSVPVISTVRVDKPLRLPDTTQSFKLMFV